MDQSKIDISEKMNYFDEALSIQKEYEKLNILYNDSINLCEKKKSFSFLINIFVKIYNHDLCPKLLNLFNKNKTDFVVDNINKEQLQKYKFNFEQIIENTEEIISKFSLDPVDFYGLILCYLNYCNNEKYMELLKKLSKKEEYKKLLYKIMIKYKIYFKKQNNINKDILNEFIKYATKKDFTIFKDNALFYLKDINTFLEIIDNNKDDIIKIKQFEPIELTIKDDEKIKFEIINPKIESITEFSKEKKSLLIYLKKIFWEALAKKSYGISRDNIELCSTIRIIFKNYYNMILNIFPDKKNDKIKKEVNDTYKRGIFLHQIDKIIRDYIDKTPDISNIEIIELIHGYDEYYTNKIYIKKRDTKILEKIRIDLNNKNNENFIKKFKEIKIEKIFENSQKNFLNIFTNKIKKISDFGMIFKLINVDLLSDKTYYLNQLKLKYENVIKVSDNDPNLIQSLVELIIYICINENKTDFLEKNIKVSKFINPKIKHKIYIGLINFCKENKN